jgi:hypothetical protein
MQRANYASALLTVLTAILLCPLFLGCGGGGDGGNPGTTPVNVTVRWPARSRAIVDAPMAALSAVITLQAAKADGTDLILTIERNDAPAAYTQTYTSTEQARAGLTTKLTVQFRAQHGGQGDLVGIAEAQTAVTQNGALRNGDGSELLLTTNDLVDSITVLPGQTVAVGEHTDLAFTARDRQGNVLAITPGSVIFSVSEGSAFLKIENGQAVGLSPGTAKVNGVDVVVTGIEDIAELVLTNNGPAILNTWQAGIPAGQILEIQIWRLPDVPFSLQGTPVAAFSTVQNPYSDLIAPFSWWNGTNSFLQPGGPGGIANVVTPPAGAVQGPVPGQTYTYQVTAVVRQTLPGGVVQDVYVGSGTSGPATLLVRPAPPQVTSTNVKSFNATWPSVKGADEFQLEVTAFSFDYAVFTARFPAVSTAPNVDGVAQTLPAPVDLT